MPEGKPNILVIWGDDIGISNLSCYSDGLMGYRTPNIDRIASEGRRFTDSYGEQSCTAGRAAFISGQSVYRTGMSKVGVPGVNIGWAAEDPTIAELLKPLGYATVHGFDEFFGNLYHLNAEEEPEQFDYPHKDQFPRLYELALPRGVMKCKATDEVSSEPDDPKFGPVGKQTIEDTGPLTAKRMETIDDDIADATIDYIKRQYAEGNLGRAIHAATGAQAVQPAHRPVRVRRHHVKHILRMVPATRLLRLLRDGDGVGVSRHVQGISAATPTSHLQHRSNRQEAGRVPGRRLGPDRHTARTIQERDCA